MIRRSSNRTKQLQEASTEGRVTIQLYNPELQKGTTRPEGCMVNEVAIRKALFRPDFSSHLGDCAQGDILFGRGIVVVDLNGVNLKCLLAFPPKRSLASERSQYEYAYI